MLSRWRKPIETNIEACASQFQLVESLSQTVPNDKLQLELEDILQYWPERVLTHPSWTHTRPIGDMIPALQYRDIQVTPALVALDQGLRAHSLVNISIESLLLEQQGLSVIFGEAGSGKTTLLKQITSTLIDPLKKPSWLPLYCSLEDYSHQQTADSKTDLLMFILQQCGVQNKQQQSHWSVVLRALARHKKIKVLLLFDDLPAVSVVSKRLVLREIQALSDLFAVIVCADYAETTSKLKASNHYQLSSLTMRGRRCLIENYCSLVAQPERAIDVQTFLNASDCYANAIRTPASMLIFCAAYLQSSVVMESVSINHWALTCLVVKQLVLYQHSRSSGVLAPKALHYLETLAFNLCSHNAAQQGVFELDVLPQWSLKQGYVAELKQSVFLTRIVGMNSPWGFSDQLLQAHFCARYVLQLSEYSLSALVDKQLLNPQWLPVWKLLAASHLLAQAFWDKCKRLLSSKDRYSVVIVLLAKLMSGMSIVDGGNDLLGINLKEQLEKIIASSCYPGGYQKVLDRLKFAPAPDERQPLTDSVDKVSGNDYLGKLKTLSTLNSDYSELQVWLTEWVKSKRQLRLQPWRLTSDLTLEKSTALINISKIADAAIPIQRWLLAKVQYMDHALAVQVLQEWLIQAQSREFKTRIIRSLGELQDSAAQSFMYRQLVEINGDLQAEILSQLQVVTDKQAELISPFTSLKYHLEIRQQAIKALSYSTAPPVVYQLQALAQFDQSQPVKLAALAALKGKKLLGSIVWLVNMLNSDRFSNQLRLAAFELLMFYRNQQYPQVTAPLEQLLYRQVIIGLRNSSDIFSELAAKNSASFGPLVSQQLLHVCADHNFSDLVRGYACQALAAIGCLKAIPRLLQIINNHQYSPGETINTHSLAWSAAQAMVRLNVELAAKSRSPWLIAALTEHCLEYNLLIVQRDCRNNKGQKKTKAFAPSLDDSLDASEQLNKMRALCQYLLAHGYVSLTANNPKQMQPPLFDKPSPASISATQSVNINTGRKFLKGGKISSASASKILDRLRSLPFSGLLY